MVRFFSFIWRFVNATNCINLVQQKVKRKETQRKRQRNHNFSQFSSSSSQRFRLQPCVGSSVITIFLRRRRCCSFAFPCHFAERERATYLPGDGATKDRYDIPYSHSRANRSDAKMHEKFLSLRIAGEILNLLMKNVIINIAALSLVRFVEC